MFHRLRRLTFTLVLIVFLLASHTARAVDLLLIPVEGGEPRVLLSDPKRAIGSPDWSPDGKVIAFDTWEKRGNGSNTQDSQIALFTIESGEFKLLGPGAMPNWSPDGTQLVCHTYRPSQIVVVNADGSGREAILDQWGCPRWSADGRAIYTVFQRGGIAKFDIQTGKQKVVAARNDSLWQGMSVSPTGDGLCFSSRSGGIGVALRDDRGEFTTTWKWPNLNGMHSSWSPDGKRIVAAVRHPGRDDEWYLYLLDPYGDDPPTPVPGNRKRWIGVDPDWSPDGESIVCTGELVP